MQLFCSACITSNVLSLPPMWLVCSQEPAVAQVAGAILNRATFDICIYAERIGICDNDL